MLMVCLGNICRSPAAQAVMQRLVDARGLTERFHIDSAGLGGWHVGVEDFDLIVGMDAGNVDELCDRAATIEQQNKVVMMGDYIRRYPHYDYVPDPYYEGSEGFELVLDLLEDSCECLLDSILQQNNILQ